MKSPPRVVLDTNVVLSALLFARGRLSPLRLAWQQGRFEPLVSQATTAELMRVLHYAKFRLGPEDMRDLLAEYLPWCTALAIPEKPPKVPECRDPGDVPFLQLALVSKADYLVTGDRHLLELARKFARPIVPADTFLGLMKEGT